MWSLHLGKTKHLWVSKKAVAWSKILGEKLFFDISSHLTLTFGGKKHWLLVIDDSSNYVWRFFLKEKSDLADIMLGLIENLKDKYNLQVQYLCCDDAGKNITFKKACKQEGLRVDFKYTAPGMPQQNGCIEWKFPSLFYCINSMFSGGRLTLTYKMAYGPKLWTLSWCLKTIS